MNRIDLQVHTNVSDGELSPEEVVSLAIKRKLKAIAITDHDTIRGALRAIKYVEGKNIEVVPGIEISCCEKEMGFEEVHILGLFVNLKTKNLRKFTERIRLERIRQKKQIIRNLDKLGFKIKFKDIKSLNNFSIGRSHIAKILVDKYPEEFTSIKDVFEKYIGVGKPAYSERENTVKITEAIEVIKKAKGVSILAHPGVYQKEDSLELINYFIKNGGSGIEVYYPYDFICRLSKKKSKELHKFYNTLAKRLRILRSGGSDFHGSIRKKVKLGHLNINEGILEEIKKWRQKNL